MGLPFSTILIVSPSIVPLSKKLNCRLSLLKTISLIFWIFLSAGFRFVFTIGVSVLFFLISVLVGGLTGFTFLALTNERPCTKFISSIVTSNFEERGRYFFSR